MDRRFALLRVLACFMVIQLHVAGELYRDLRHAGWWAGNVYDSLTRSCVPLFFMLAGATLLRRDEPLGDFMRKRALRIFPPLLFWSLFYLWWLWYNDAGPSNWIAAIASGSTMFHLWYFYALVGLYAIVPVLRKFYVHSSMLERGWLIAAWVAVASLLPTARELMLGPRCDGILSAGDLVRVYSLSYLGGHAGFMVLGAVLADRPLGRRVGLILFAAASLGTMAASAWLSHRYGTACEFFFVYLSPLVVLAAAGLFSVVMSASPGAPSRWLMHVSECTLGIYGLHVFMIDPVFMRQGFVPSAAAPWVSAPLIAVGVFAACLAVVSAVRLVKPVRWFV